MWAILDPDALSGRARKAIEDPGHRVCVSPVSTWEILVKHGRGRLPLPDDPERWLAAERTRHRFDPLPLDEAAVLQLPRLPVLHRDPFDRMLVCQAIAAGAIIVTPDRAIADYPVRALW